MISDATILGIVTAGCALIGLLIKSNCRRCKLGCLEFEKEVIPNTNNSNSGNNTPFPGTTVTI